MRVLTDEDLDKVSGGATPSDTGFGRNTAFTATQNSNGSFDNYYSNGYDNGYPVAHSQVPTGLEPADGTATTSFGFPP